MHPVAICQYFFFEKSPATMIFGASENCWEDFSNYEDIFLFYIVFLIKEHQNRDFLHF